MTVVDWICDHAIKGFFLVHGQTGSTKLVVVRADLTSATGSGHSLSTCMCVKKREGGNIPHPQSRPVGYYPSDLFPVVLVTPSCLKSVAAVIETRASIL